MKKTIQTRRGSSNSSAFKKLYAKTKTNTHRKMKAATASMDSMELESDIPNVGVGRALLVMLVLHVVAIGAFYIHNTFFATDGGSPVSTTAEAPVAPAAKPRQPAPQVQPPVQSAPVVAAVAYEAPQRSQQIRPLSNRYIVESGDTYQSISGSKNVDEISLRALNNERPLRSGVVLDLPAELSSRPVAVTSELSIPASEPRAERVRPEPRVQRVAPRAIIVDEEPAAAVVVRPSANRAPEAVSHSGKSYTVKSGDTLWRISSNYGVSVNKLKKINGIEDVTTLRLGQVLKIPAK